VTAGPAVVGRFPTKYDVTGKVVEVSGTNLIVVTENGDRMTFVAEDASKMPAGLLRDQMVRVEYQRLDNGTLRLQTATADPSIRWSTDASRYDDEDMPRTASPLPIFAAGAVLAIGLALGLRAVNRREA
jgi:hypothetical protein